MTGTAQSTWEGTLESGGATVTTMGGGLDGEPVTCRPAGTPGHRTVTPEELAAAAHAASFALALSRQLDQRPAGGRGLSAVKMSALSGPT